MQHNFQMVDENELLEEGLEKLKSSDLSMLPVVRDQDLVGLITMENFGEWVMVESALNRSAH